MKAIAYFDPPIRLTDFTAQYPSKKVKLVIPEHPTLSVMKTTVTLLPQIRMLRFAVEVPPSMGVAMRMVMVEEFELDEFVRAFPSLLAREALTYASLPPDARLQAPPPQDLTDSQVGLKPQKLAPIVGLGALTDEQTRKLDEQTHPPKT